jgi:hypothetical protein
MVRLVLPVPGQADLRDVLDGLAEAPVVLPFSEDRMAFAADLSRALSKRGGGRPEVQALAFWMRKAELHRLAQSFDALQSDTVRLMPRGTVFHVPPANVDTLFVYSWLLSMLVGNRNVVRLSSRIADSGDLILDVVAEVLAAHPVVARSTVMLTYGHEAEITAALSAVCDTRVIWGGDQTVRSVRSAPLPVHATELAFPDRFSLAAMSASFYAGLGEADRDELAVRFFNDAYVFDQLACSSPRLLVWVGEPGDLAQDFFDRVAKAAAGRGYGVDARAAIAKLGEAYSAMIDLPVMDYARIDHAVTVLRVHDFPQVRGAFCGAGFFFQMQVGSLLELVPHIERADQTLAVAGLDQVDLRAFVDALVGRGIDRIVPIGQALQFDRMWDGYDLLQEFTRRVVVTAQNA